MSSAVLERSVSVGVASAAPTGATPSACPSTTHDSAKAYIKGCRHPEAVKAHEEYRQRRTERDRRARQAARQYPRTNPACSARQHPPTIYAARNGCTCEGALYAYRTWELERKLKAARKALRAADLGRFRWRGPHRRVSLNNLILLRRGFVDSPTSAERQLAWLYLDSCGVVAEEIAKRLGVDGGYPAFARQTLRELREQRTQRRLADVRWRIARNALIATLTEIRDREAHAVESGHCSNREEADTVSRRAALTPPPQKRAEGPADAATEPSLRSPDAGADRTTV